MENRCSVSRTVRAEEVEAEALEFVRGALTDPARLSAGPKKMQESEARAVGGASAEGEEASWPKRISEVEPKEGRLLGLRLEGDMTAERFRDKSAALESRKVATAGLEAARSRRSRREEFERDKEVLLEYHACLVPENLAPEQRHALDRMMRLVEAPRLRRPLGFRPVLPGDGSGEGSRWKLKERRLSAGTTF